MIRTPNFFKGELKYLILKSLSRQPLHGYMLMKTIQENNMGLWRPTPGALYPALEALKKDGLIEIDQQERKGRNKKIYRITAHGRKSFHKLYARVDEMERAYLEYMKKNGPAEPEDPIYLLEFFRKIFSAKDLIEQNGIMLEFASLSRRGKITAEIQKEFAGAMGEFLKKIKKISEKAKG